MVGTLDSYAGTNMQLGTPSVSILGVATANLSVASTRVPTQVKFLRTVLPFFNMNDINTTSVGEAANGAKSGLMLGLGTYYTGHARLIAGSNLAVGFGAMTGQDGGPNCNIPGFTTVPDVNRVISTSG